MCDPATMLAVGSTAFSAYGAYQGAKAEKANAKFQQAQAEQNAKIQNEAALDATRRGAVEENTKRIQNNQFAARQKAVFAAGGTDYTTGSQANVLNDTIKFGELDAQLIRSNAARESYNLRVGAANYQSQASAYGAEAKNTKPLMAATGSLLNGARQTSSAWRNYKLDQKAGLK